MEHGTPPQPASTTAVVVGPQYCCPQPLDLTIVGSRKITVTNGNSEEVVFKLERSHMSLHDHRVLCDADQKPIVTLRSKVRSIHGRWQAFTGNSHDPKDLMFTLKRSNMIQIRTRLLDVFLASNTSGKVCDYKIKGSWRERSCDVYAGESDIVLAQMLKTDTATSVQGKTNVTVRVRPNVDYAFIVSLVVILDSIVVKLAH